MKRQDLTIHVAPEMHDDLGRRATARGITVRDLIRQSLALEDFLWEKQQSGSELLIRKGRKITRVELT
jgi:hypothetical protein